LIKRLGGDRIQEEILCGHQLYYSSEFNLLKVPGSVYGGPTTAIIIYEYVGVIHELPLLYQLSLAFSATF